MLPDSGWGWGWGWSYLLTGGPRATLFTVLYFSPRVEGSMVKLWNGEKALRNQDSTQIYASFFNPGNETKRSETRRSTFICLVLWSMNRNTSLANGCIRLPLWTMKGTAELRETPLLARDKNTLHAKQRPPKLTRSCGCIFDPETS